MTTKPPAGGRPPAPARRPAALPAAERTSPPPAVKAVTAPLRSRISAAPTIYQARRGTVNALLAAAIVTLGSALAALGFSLWAWYFAMSTYGPAAVRRWTTPWLIAAPLLGIIGLACLVRVWRLVRRWVEVFPDGLRVHRGRREDWIAWPAIREIRTSSARQPGPTFAALEIRLIGGRRLRLTRSLTDLETLVQRVKQGAYPLLQEAYRAKFNRGEELDFGQLRLTPEGVQAGRKTIQWGHVQAVEVRAGQLTLSSDEPAGPRIRVAAVRVPNIDVCVQIIRLLGQVP